MWSDPPFPGFWQFVALMFAMIAWRLWGWRLRKALQDFEQHRRDADLQLLYDRANPTSHFRQSVDQINEDTPSIEQSPSDPTYFVWNSETYSSRADAEAARWLYVLREARSFYQDLDRSFGNRISGKRSADSLNRDDGSPKS